MQKYDAKDVADDRFGSDDKIVYLAAEADAALAEKDARIAGLLQYAQHKKDCASLDDGFEQEDFERAGCDCGLARFL